MRGQGSPFLALAMAEQVPAELASFLAGIKLPHLGDLLVFILRLREVGHN